MPYLLEFPLKCCPIRVVRPECEHDLISLALCVEKIWKVAWNIVRQSHSSLGHERLVILSSRLSWPLYDYIMIQWNPKLWFMNYLTMTLDANHRKTILYNTSRGGILQETWLNKTFPLAHNHYGSTSLSQTLPCPIDHNQIPCQRTRGPLLFVSSSSKLLCSLFSVSSYSLAHN